MIAKNSLWRHHEVFAIMKWPGCLGSGSRTSAMGSTLTAMTNSDYPWEPPLAGSEVEHLTGALDRLRTTFRFKADDLDAAGLNARVGASALTIGGLLKHLALCEDFTFTVKLTGGPLGPLWDTAGWD